jgi:hypothetical protein
VVVFALMYCIGPCLDVYVLVEDLCSIYKPLWLVMAHPFSPHFKIGVAFMASTDCPLMFGNSSSCRSLMI